MSHLNGAPSMLMLDQPAEPGGVFPNFHYRSVQNMDKSREEGRPIFERVEFVTLRIIGDKDNIPVHRVHDGHRRRFPREYAAFKADRDQDEAAGTLLSAWGQLDEAEVDNLAHGPGRIRTVEQLAAVSDSNLQILGPGGRKLREKAQTYIDFMKGSAPLAKLQAEKDELESRCEAMEKQMAQMSARIEELLGASAEKKPKK